ncbi:hypothetical protein [Burkholderia pyrrocinia]|uniref:hypothetical protein n=1 Tax=Burkholderia pyrrocinia TaxID=60550 RepID=UPI0030CD3369
MKCDVLRIEAFLKGVRRTGCRPNISKFFKADGLAYIGQRLGLSAAIEAGGRLIRLLDTKNIREKESNDASEQSEAVVGGGFFFADSDGLQRRRDIVRCCKRQQLSRSRQSGGQGVQRSEQLFVERERVARRIRRG